MEELFAAKIKQLTGDFFFPHLHHFIDLLAENVALRKAKAVQHNTAPLIPRPERGSGGNGFNLQAKMGLKDDNELYGALRVSFSFFSPFLLSEIFQRCVRDAVNKAGLDYRIKWHRQPKQLIIQVIGVVSPLLDVLYKSH